MNDAIDTTALEAAIRKDAYTESDLILEREATALSAVAVVMGQRGRDHPTLLSAWTTREIARLLHALADDPGAEVRLGDQYLGKRLAKTRYDNENESNIWSDRWREKMLDFNNAMELLTPEQRNIVGGKHDERQVHHVEDYSKQGSEG